MQANRGITQSVLKHLEVAGAQTNRDVAERLFGGDTHKSSVMMANLVKSGRVTKAEIPGKKHNEARMLYELNINKEKEKVKTKTLVQGDMVLEKVLNMVRNNPNINSVQIAEQLGYAPNHIAACLFTLHKKGMVKRAELTGAGPRYSYTVNERSRAKFRKVKKVTVGEPQWSVVVKPKIVKKEVEVLDIPMLFVFEIGKNTVTFTEDEARKVYVKLKGLFG